MENKKSKKFNIILYIIVLLAMAIMFASFYFLYQKKVVEPSTKETVVNKFQMLLMFNKDDQINGHNIKPGWEDSREFSIENFSSDTIGKYNIILEIITPLSNMIDENFVYTLVGESESSDTSNKVINVSETPVPVVTRDLGTAVITPKNKENYKITFSLKKGTKKYPSENIFSVKIKIVNAD
jgi:hypothetical protein